MLTEKGENDLRLNLISFFSSYGRNKYENFVPSNLSSPNDAKYFLY